MPLTMTTYQRKNYASLLQKHKIIQLPVPKWLMEIVFHLLRDIYFFNPNTVSKPYLQEAQDAGYVDWLGSQSSINVIYQNTYLAVLPSYYWEGFPKSLLEAVAYGLPIITTDAPGCREICIHKKNGLFVKIKDSELIGIPLNIVIGKKFTENNEVELIGRNGEISSNSIEDIKTILEFFKN